MNDEITHIFPEVVEEEIVLPKQGEKATEVDSNAELLAEIKDLKVMIKTLTRLMEANND